MTGQIDREQMRSITFLHESFARNLTHSLAAYLRITFAAALVSAEYLSFSEFLQSIPEVTYLASCRLAPMGSAALLQLDLALAFPLIDVLLGGEGKGVVQVRAITEIEEQILETVMRIICRELQTAWQALSLEFQFDQRLQVGQVQQLMPLGEKTLLLSFEITMLESRGTLNLVVPALASSALLRKISESAAAKPRMRPDAERRLRAGLLPCPFRLELCLTGLRVPVRELTGLAPGMLLDLCRRVQQPAALMVEDHALFPAVLIRRGVGRAAHLLARQPDWNLVQGTNP
jgi:flagellar motor switch protein FliM